MLNKGSALLSAASEMMSFSFGQPLPPLLTSYHYYETVLHPHFFFFDNSTIRETKDTTTISGNA